MAAGPEPYAHVRRARLDGQRTVGASTRLGFPHGTIHSLGRGRAAQSHTVGEPPESVPKDGPTVVKSVLQPVHAECFARERLWRNEQRGQHAQLQQPRLIQPWRRRWALLWGASAVRGNA